ncbi:DUF6843 domain-containing protein [Pseudoalteromonas ostreae]|uniref:DUF6843 domain-containing protein n=1 Tax=Pseudoalteromonas ostreae TaxID=2774154 RepID=UPI001B364D3D|nr:hypothetical protein [Pseudoalteromonas ostreae]
MKSSFNVHFLKVLFISLTIALLSACTEIRKSEPAIYLIPDGYVGSLYIIFNAPNGQPPKYEGDSRVYEIPPSGVLVTQMDVNEGRIESNKLRFYYVNKIGDRTPITERITSTIHDTPENRKDKKIIIFGGGLGEVEPINNCQINDQSFVIGRKSDLLDSKNMFDIFDAIKLKNSDGKFFDNICPDRKRASPAVYLIPENYKGTFYIVYNAPKGTPAKYENGVPVFAIPPSGMLVTQAKSSAVWEENPPNWHFYYVNNAGDRPPIEGRWSSDNVTEGLVTFHTSVGAFEPTKGCNARFQEFAIGTSEEITKNTLYFDIYGEKGIKNMDKSIFKGACFLY